VAVPNKSQHLKECPIKVEVRGKQLWSPEDGRENETSEGKGPIKTLAISKWGVRGRDALPEKKGKRGGERSNVQRSF